MTYAIVIPFLLVLIAAVIMLFSYKGRSNQALNGEPLNISGWEKVDKEVATQGGFVITGDAINYGGGRPYKLHMKREIDGSKTWYAEMVDTGEWYKTNIGKK